MEEVTTNRGLVKLYYREGVQRGKLGSKLREYAEQSANLAMNKSLGEKIGSWTIWIGIAINLGSWIANIFIEGTTLFAVIGSTLIIIGWLLEIGSREARFTSMTLADNLYRSYMDMAVLSHMKSTSIAQEIIRRGGAARFGEDGDYILTLTGVVTEEELTEIVKDVDTELLNEEDV